MIPGLQAVVFDFDGVLVESVEVKTEAFAAFYESEGKEIVAAVTAHHRLHGGKSRYEKFHHYETVLLGRPAPPPERMAALDRAFSELVERKVVAAPEVRGAEQLLRALQGRLPSHLVSATPESELKRILEARGWAHYFECIHGSPKTKSENLSALIARQEYDPAHILFVGDMIADYEASRQCRTAFLGRVPPSGESLFPATVPTVTDMHGAAGFLGLN